MCWISFKTVSFSFNSCVIMGNSFYFALLLPVVLILLVNFVVLVMVMRVLTQKNNASSQKQKGKVQARIAFACATLLGLTWIFGLLAIGEMTYAFQLLFTIFNSLQGFFIFVFYTLMNKPVQKKWKRLLRLTKTEQYSIGMNSSMTSQTSTVSTLSKSDVYINEGKFFFKKFLKLPKLSCILKSYIIKIGLFRGLFILEFCDRV